MALCLLAPRFAQGADRQVIADAINAANWQKRLDVGRDQVRAHQFSPEAFKKQEQETEEAIAKLRARQSIVDRPAFEYAFWRATHDEAYRMSALDQSDRSGSEGIPWAGISLVVVIVVIFASMVISAKNRVPITSTEKAKPDTTYGSADYAQPTAAIPNEDYLYNGVFFGKSSAPGMEELPTEQHHGAPVCSTPQNHSLIVARTRTGKGTRVVIPTLLRCKSSAFVIDPKGENAAVTARARMAPGRPGGGQTVHIVNPWGELDPTFVQLGFKYATYNPLDILDPKDKETNLVSNAQALAKAICPSDKEGREAFWNQNASAILTAVLLWLTVTKGETKTLARAREILTKSKKQFEDNFLVHMAASVECGGAIQENSARFVGMAAETYSGIMANVAQNTDFLSDPMIKAATNTSSFSMLELVQRPTTIYLVIPPDRMEMQRTWLRLLITAGLQIYKRHSVPRKQAQRCLFLIDELPALGRIDELPRGIADMAGYGVDFALIVQGVEQLEDAYAKSAGTIINNCHYKWFCNIGDLKTAKFVSDTLGKQTVQTHGQTTGTSLGKGGGSSSQSTTIGQTGRPLLMPDEVLTLGRDTAILLAPTGKPHYLIPVDYWKLPETFAAHQKKYPRWLWKPPLEWDENPLPH